MTEENDPLHDIVGQDLSAVTFVRDYVQLQFDGPMMNVLTPIVVRAGTLVSRQGGDGFRDALCGQISKTVVGARADEDDALTISFSDGSAVSISLKQEDYVGPEAVVIWGTGPRWAVM